MGKCCAIAIAMVIVGCIDSQSVECSFGLCPPGSQCDEDAKACIPPGCGNMQLEGTEQCDGSVDANHDCTSFGYYLPNGLACSRECTFDTSSCGGGLCGDHATNGPELCDGMPPLGLACADFGFQIGRLACGVDCAPAFATCGELGWHTSRGNALDEMHAVWGTVNGLHLYAVGRGGHILEGNGTVWVEVESPTTNNLDGVWGVSKDNIYAVGAAGTILHYNGTTWSTMASGTTADLHAISGTFVDPSGTTPAEMWAVGDGGTILHAQSSNATWTAENSTTVVNLHGVWAYGVDAPVAVGEAATTGTAPPTALIRTGTWTPMTVPAVTMTAGTASLDAVWGIKNPMTGVNGFVGVGTVTSATGRGIVLAVQSPSTTWAFTGQSIATTDLKSVWGAVTNRVDIYIGGLSGALVHWNGTAGAANFYAYNSNTSRAIRGLWGLNPVFVKAATLGGEIQEYDGTDLQSQDLALLDTNLATHVFSGVWADPASQNVVAVGELGRVARHTNAGWSIPLAVNGAGAWNAVWGSGMTVAIAGIAAQGLAISVDGGANFGPGALSGIGINWFGVWGTSQANIYAVGSQGGTTGALAHFNGTWTQLADVGNKRLNAIWGTSDSDIFVVGNNAFIAHSTNGGASWTPQTSPITTVALNAVWGSAANDVWAVGGSGTILHYDGTAWHQRTSTTAQDLYSIGGTSANDVFAGGRGTVLHWQGVQWQALGVDLEDAYGMAIERGASYVVGSVLRGGTIDAGALQFIRTPTVDTEFICADAWDNDGDGLVGCEDPDCACATQPCGDTDYKGCQSGGACAPTEPLACGESTVDASTYTGIGRIDDLPCLDHATPGPEASYRFVADHDGTVMVTFDDPSGELDLVQLDPFDNLSVSTHRRYACDPGHCVAAPVANGTRTLSIPVKGGETYYLLVDGPANTAGKFTLSLDCP